MSKTKPVKLRAFVIENTDIKLNSSDLLQNIISVLKESMAKDRRMLLSAKDPSKEEDLICDYDIQNDKLVSGAMLRIRPSDQVMNIPDTLFDEPKIVLQDLENVEVETEIIYKDHYYFMMNHKYLVTSLPGTYSVVRFQTYINWLLKSVRGTKLYEFTPKVTLQPNLKIYDLKRIRVSDPANNEVFSKNEDSDTVTTLKNLPFHFLKKFVTDVDNLDETTLAEVVSAELLLKFNKPKTMSVEEYQRSLGAYLKPISDTDHISLYPKKGKPISGKDVIEMRELRIETTDSGKISEKELTQEMEKYLIDLLNENNS